MSPVCRECPNCGGFHWMGWMSVPECRDVLIRQCSWKDCKREHVKGSLFCAKHGAEVAWADSLAAGGGE